MCPHTNMYAHVHTQRKKIEMDIGKVTSNKGDTNSGSELNYFFLLPDD